VIAASNIAIPGACICIQRRIYHVLSDPLATISTAQVRLSGLLRCLKCSDDDFLQETTQFYVGSVFLSWFPSSVPSLWYIYIYALHYEYKI
jgi:hypothetical protein